MANDLPTAAQVRERLQGLSWAQVQRLCCKTGAPFTTVWKLRSGETADPRLETVRLIWPDIAAPKAEEVSHG